jgi:hypothetical protein
MLTALLSLLLSGPNPQPGHLVLEASSPQKTVVLGEPLKLVVRWRALDGPVSALIDDDFTHGQHVGFRIEDSAGSRTYGEERRGHSEMEVVTSVAPDRDHVSNLVLAYGLDNEEGQRFVVPCKHVGPCSIRVIYVEHNREIATSNSVPFDVRTPTGEDQVVLAAIKKAIGILQCGYPGGPAKAKALLARFPHSPHLRWAAISCLQNDCDIFYGSHQDPETGDMLGKLPEPERTARTQAVVRNLRDKIVGLGDLGPFEVERLDLAVTLATLASGGDADDLTRTLKAELLSRFPDSEAATRIRKEETEEPDKDDSKE